MTLHTDLPQQADIAARLAPIRAHFVSTLGPRRDRLAAFCAEPDPLPAPERIRLLQEDAHKIRGVALTLGFEGLGHHAGTVDELLAPWVKTVAALPIGSSIIAALSDLLGVIDRAMAGQA